LKREKYRVSQNTNLSDKWRYWANLRADAVNKNTVISNRKMKDNCPSNYFIQNTKKPDLRKDAPTAVVLFAGGGGVEAGLIEAGILPVMSVELDPDREKLSSAIANIHEKNFAEYGCKIIRETVEQCAAEHFEGFPKNPFLLHSSNVCKGFSNANGEKGETRKDIDAAIAVVIAIRELNPENFTLEQVAGYQYSESFKTILDNLDELGYNTRWNIVNLADFGVPQSRSRLILRASRNGEPIPLPPSVNRVSWDSAIEDLIPNLPDSTLTEGQQKAIASLENPKYPILIGRVGRSAETIRESGQTSFTLVSAIFTDQKLSNRSKFANIVTSDGVKDLSIQCAARLQGFPDWYEFGEESAIAGTIIGNSVPPLFIYNLFKSVVSKETKTDLMVNLPGGRQEVELSKLHPHPLQVSIYGEEDIEKSPVFLAIAESQDIEPITITPINSGYEIIKGHTRARAAEKLGWQTIPCHVVSYLSQEARDEAFLNSNTTRQETNEQKAKRAAAWWQIIEAKNAARRSSGKPDGLRTTTREEVAKLVGGWSATTTERAVRVVDSIKDLAPEQAEVVRSDLNCSVNKAYKKVAEQREARFNPKIFDRVRIIGGQFKGQSGEVRGISGRYCLVSLDGRPPEERESIFIHEMEPESSPIAEPSQPLTRVRDELTEKGKELGLRGKGQLLPDTPQNEGFNPKQEYIGLTMPTNIAVALSKLTPEQIAYCMAIALPEMSREQIQAITNSLPQEVAA
jgi:DNA (cytosine-5)-methyltransferase 1